MEITNKKQRLKVENCLKTILNLDPKFRIPKKNEKIKKVHDYFRGICGETILRFLWICDIYELLYS